MRKTANLAARKDNFRNLEETFTYDPPNRPKATDIAVFVVGLSHRGSRVGFQAAAAMRQPYGGPMGNLGSWTTITDAGGTVVHGQNLLQ